MPKNFWIWSTSPPFLPKIQKLLVHNKCPKTFGGALLLTFRAHSMSYDDTWWGCTPWVRSTVVHYMLSILREGVDGPKQFLFHLSSPFQLTQVMLALSKIYLFVQVVQCSKSILRWTYRLHINSPVFSQLSEGFHKKKHGKLFTFCG